MKTVVTSFVRDQSGAADFNDRMTGFILVVVFPIAVTSCGPHLVASSMPFSVWLAVLLAANSYLDWPAPESWRAVTSRSPGGF
jgi:hypothetical protein